MKHTFSTMNILLFRPIILGALSIVAAFSLVYALWANSESNFKSGTSPRSANSPSSGSKTMNAKKNPVAYFEIPVLDMERAVRFYANVFDADFTREKIDGNEMALFPLDKVGSGVSGALAKGEIYKPSTTGTLVYFHCNDIDATLGKAQERGGKILYPKTSVGANGFVAELQDSEGNRIALLQSK